MFYVVTTLFKVRLKYLDLSKSSKVLLKIAILLVVGWWSLQLKICLLFPVLFMLELERLQFRLASMLFYLGGNTARAGSRLGDILRLILVQTEDGNRWDQWDKSELEKNPQGQEKPKIWIWHKLTGRLKQISLETSKRVCRSVSAVFQYHHCVSYGSPQRSKECRTLPLSFSVQLRLPQHALKRFTKHYKLPAAFVVQASADGKSFLVYRPVVWQKEAVTKALQLLRHMVCDRDVYCTEYPAKCISHQREHSISPNHCLL